MINWLFWIFLPAIVYALFPKFVHSINGLVTEVIRSVNEFILELLSYIW